MRGWEVGRSGTIIHNSLTHILKLRFPLILGICASFFGRYAVFRLKRVPGLREAPKCTGRLRTPQKTRQNHKNLLGRARTRETGSRGATKLSQSRKSEAPDADDFAPGCSDPAQREGECRAAQTARGRSCRNRIPDFLERRLSRVEMGNDDSGGNSHFCALWDSRRFGCFTTLCVYG